MLSYFDLRPSRDGTDLNEKKLYRAQRSARFGFRGRKDGKQRTSSSRSLTS